jgi:hypothetical protein
MADKADKAGKVRAGLVTGPGGKSFLVVGSNVYWDPAILGATSDDLVGKVRAFYTYGGRSFFESADIVANILGDDPTVQEVVAEVNARLVDV